MVSFFKPPPEWVQYAMVGGPCSFAMVGLLPLVFGFENIGNATGIVLLFVFQGLGRGVWESTNKAIFMQYFSYDTVGTGSNLIIQNGGAAAIGFFVNTYSSASPSVGDCDVGAYNRTVVHAGKTVIESFQGDCPKFAAEAWVVVLASAG